MPYSFQASHRISLVILGAALVACGTSDTAPRRVVIPAGSSFRAATDSLVSARIISSPRIFRIYSTVRGQDRAVKPGTYLLRPGTSWPAILHALTVGSACAPGTVPEGFALSAIEPLIVRTLSIDPNPFP